MNAHAAPRVLSIPAGAPFLETLASVLTSGKLIPGFGAGSDPLALSSATIYVPTRRAARRLRSIFAARSGSRAAILPTIKALGEFDDGEAAFDEAGAALLALAPPIPPLDRLLLLAPLVRAWKEKLPQHVARLFNEEIIVPASTADSIWLARDLAALMDEVELEGSDWTKLKGLVTDNLAGWWQVTLDFLEIVTDYWPRILRERNLSNPAAHRDALLRGEADRLRNKPPQGPVIAAGSTGSIPATAELLSVISRLPNGAVVLPGLDMEMDRESWELVRSTGPEPSVFGHPQFGLGKLLEKIGIERREVLELGDVSALLADRAWLVGEAMRPADSTDMWPARRAEIVAERVEEALRDVTLIEAANERDEAAAIAVVLRQAIEEPDAVAALVTGDRNLARRVATELRRFGIEADDSGGTPLLNTPAASLLRLLARAAFEPGDPVAIISLLKHPLLQLGLPRAVVRRAAETVELVALRGGTGRPDLLSLPQLFDSRLDAFTADSSEGRRLPHWLARLDADRITEARSMLAALAAAVAPLAAMRANGSVLLADVARVSVQSLEALGRTQDGTLDSLYGRDSGEKLADTLRQLVGSAIPFDLPAAEWSAVLNALLAPEVVKPAQWTDPRISIWGPLEARLQSADTLVLGGLKEGSWPRKPEADRLMSRVMKTGIDLEPPERRIGLAAHDFQMSMGAPKVVLTRSARDGDAPTVPSRWLQRLTVFVGAKQADAMRKRGEFLLRWGRSLDEGDRQEFAPRPQPAPPLSIRPTHFSVTEIETLRRDPYAIYARRILGLIAIDPLIRDPGAAERGTLFHEILHRFTVSGMDPRDPAALGHLLEQGRACFAAEELPVDVHAIWWPRFQKLAANIIAWEIERADSVVARHAEARAAKTEVARTGVTLSGYADRIDLLPADMADILDYKTGSYPSKRQAHTLLSPQLALEAALLKRGAFRTFGAREPGDLAYIRLKASGEVKAESILEIKGSLKSGGQLAEEAWRRLEELLLHYQSEENGYLSRALPFREGETGGDYDHLARVLEWSAGRDAAEGAE